MYVMRTVFCMHGMNVWYECMVGLYCMSVSYRILHVLYERSVSYSACSLVYEYMVSIMYRMGVWYRCIESYSACMVCMCGILWLRPQTVFESSHGTHDG